VIAPPPASRRSRGKNDAVPYNLRVTQRLTRIATWHHPRHVKQTVGADAASFRKGTTLSPDVSQMPNSQSNATKRPFRPRFCSAFDRNTPPWPRICTQSAENPKVNVSTRMGRTPRTTAPSANKDRLEQETIGEESSDASWRSYRPILWDHLCDRTGGTGIESRLRRGSWDFHFLECFLSCLGSLRRSGTPRPPRRIRRKSD